MTEGHQGGLGCTRMERQPRREHSPSFQRIAAFPLPTCPGAPLCLSCTNTHTHTARSHTCTDTLHKHRHHRHTLAEFTLLPSFGQETAQCREAPFSIFVVTPAWLLREREGGAGGTRRGGVVAERCHGAAVAERQSGLGARVERGPGAAPLEQPTAARARGGSLALRSPTPHPQGPASFAFGGWGRGSTAISAFLPLQTHASCRGRSGGPGSLGAASAGHASPGPPSPLSRGGGGAVMGGTHFPVPSSRCAPPHAASAHHLPIPRESQVGWRAERPRAHTPPSSEPHPYPPPSPSS